MTEIDWPALSRILAAAGLGYLGRWIQDLVSRRRRAVESDLDIIEQWLGYLTGCMKALEWLIDDFVQEQLQLAGPPEAAPEAGEIRAGYMEMYIAQRTKFENLAPKITSIEPQYSDLSPDIRRLSEIYKEVHEGFVIPLMRYLSFVDELPENTSQAEYEKGLEPHKRDLTDGVNLAKSRFSALWSDLASLHARVRRLR